MGGRWPKSKKGKIRFELSDEPPRFRDQLVWRLHELAKELGYRLELIEPPRELFSSVVAVPAPPVAVTDIDVGRSVVTNFEGVRT